MNNISNDVWKMSKLYDENHLDPVKVATVIERCVRSSDYNMKTLHLRDLSHLRTLDKM